MFNINNYHRLKIITNSLNAKFGVTLFVCIIRNTDCNLVQLQILPLLPERPNKMSLDFGSYILKFAFSKKGVKIPISISQEATLFLVLNTSENSWILQQNTSTIRWSKNWILRHHVFYFYLSIYDQGLISGVYLFCENFFNSTRKINSFEKKLWSQHLA